jgi:hypothetical protein
MKRVDYIAMAVLSLVLMFIVGCDRKATVEGQQGKKLTLTKPSSVSIKQGEVADVKISIGRGTIKEPIVVTFEQLPQGVTVVDADKKIVGEEGTYVLKADNSAVLVSDHKAQVTAKGPDGLAVSQPLEINVKEKSPS